MKKHVFNWSAIFFMCLYFWYVGQLHANVRMLGAEPEVEQQTKRYFSSVLAKNSALFDHFQSSTPDTEIVSEQSFVPFKHQFMDFSETSLYGLSVIETKIRTYTGFFYHCHHFSSTDIIYPFHYFW